MVKTFYCFYDKCYIGRLLIKSNGEKEFIAENQENYTVGANNFIKYMPLKTTDDIDVFIHERVIPDGRPDKSVWVSMLPGCTAHSSDLDIFLANHGRGINDSFWLNTEKSLDPLINY